ncbi:hypothetical protein AB1Y20_008526 [Prymnesium parvum]|uniref:Uncharacterized protein n=1 Tax=Prymnesium parvum TaxID=97485 RepID=A0AB34IT97_PRYPA
MLSGRSKDEYRRLHVIISYTTPTGELVFRFCKSPVQSDRRVHLPMCSSKTEKGVLACIEHFSGRRGCAATPRALTMAERGAFAVHAHVHEPPVPNDNVCDIAASCLHDGRIEEHDRRILDELIDLVYDRLLRNVTKCSERASIFTAARPDHDLVDLVREVSASELCGMKLRSNLYNFRDSLNDVLQFPVRISIEFEADVSELDRLVFVTAPQDKGPFQICDGGTFYANGVATLIVHHFSTYAIGILQSELTAEDLARLQRTKKILFRVKNESTTDIKVVLEDRRANVHETLEGAVQAPACSIYECLSLSSVCSRKSHTAYNVPQHDQVSTISPDGELIVKPREPYKAADAMRETEYSLYFFYRQWFQRADWRIHVQHRGIGDNVTFKDEHAKSNASPAPIHVNQ